MAWEEEPVNRDTLSINKQEPPLVQTLRGHYIYLSNIKPSGLNGYMPLISLDNQGWIEYVPLWQAGFGNNVEGLTVLFVVVCAVCVRSKTHWQQPEGILQQVSIAQSPSYT